MRKLSAEELVDVEDVILDNITEVLAARNVEGTLGRLLTELGLFDQVNEALGISSGLATWPEGKILVIGAHQKMEKDLRGIAKTLGISPKRIEFVTYDAATNFDFNKLECVPTYCAILFGCVPHSAKGKGNDSSIVTHIESNRDCFAECKRLYANGGLKITNTNFRETIKGLMDKGLVAPDVHKNTSGDNAISQ